MKKNLIYISISLVICIILLVPYETIYCMGEGDSTKGNSSINVNMNINTALKVGTLGATAIGMVKACPPQTRAGVALGLGTIGAGVILMEDYLKKGSASITNKPGGGGLGTSLNTNIKVTEIDQLVKEQGNKLIKMTQDEILKLITSFKENLIGVVYCEDSNSLEMINNLPSEGKLFIGIILLLLVAIYTNIGIILLLLTRYVYNKPISNVYMERFRKILSKNNNIMLIILFILQLFCISYSLYGIYYYVQLNY